MNGLNRVLGGLVEKADSGFFSLGIAENNVRVGCVVNSVSAELSFLPSRMSGM